MWRGEDKSKNKIRDAKMSRSELPRGFAREQQNMYYTRIYIWYFVMNTNARGSRSLKDPTLHNGQWSEHREISNCSRKPLRELT